MNNSTHTSLNDLPRNPNCANLQDYQLGIDPYVRGLVDFLKRTVTPMTIALQGEWGSGKTSLMYKLQDELCGGENPLYESVWINTWEYSLLSTSSQALLKIVAKMVTATESTNLSFSKARTVLSHLAKGVAKTALGQVSNDTSAIDAITDIFTSGGESTIGQLQAELKKNIEHRFAHSTKKGIIFFIDDLDRMNPAVAVELLELLKNIFTIDRCIFVLAIDYDVVVKGLKGKFGELTDTNEREFRSFFDKIIQVPFAMPVSNYRPNEFIVTSLKSVGYISSNDEMDTAFIEYLMSATKMSVGNNPRSIKRLMNILSLITCISQATETNNQRIFGLDKRIGKFVNFVVLAIQVQYPKIFRMLVLEPNFTSWNTSILKKMNIATLDEKLIEELVKYEESDEHWEQALYAVCDSDSYLKGRFFDISNLLNILKRNIVNEIDISRKTNPEDDYYSIGDIMQEFIQITSITNFAADDSNPVIVNDHEWKEIVKLFHSKAIQVLKRSNPQWEVSARRNTGNGGFKFSYPLSLDIPFTRNHSESIPSMQFDSRIYWEIEEDDGFERTVILYKAGIWSLMGQLDDDMNSFIKKYDWIEWVDMQAYHEEDDNFSYGHIIHSPQVSFKFKDIQRFVDDENIKVMMDIITKFVEFHLKVNELLDQYTSDNN